MVICKKCREERIFDIIGIGSSEKVQYGGESAAVDSPDIINT